MTAPPDRGDRLVLADRPMWDGSWDYGYEATKLEEHGLELRVPQSIEENERLLEEAIVLLAGGRPIDARVIGQLKKGRGIVSYSVGLDQIDLEAAESAHIEVRNVPDYCSEEVSDHAILLLLAAARRLPLWLDHTRRGSWKVQSDQLLPRRIRDMTAGIVGVGRIGGLVASKARGLGMNTIGFDPMPSPGVEDAIELVTLDELLARADVIVLCAPAQPGNAALLTREHFQRFEIPGPIIVNVSRGSLIDETALNDALFDGRVASAALDVRFPEPPGDDDPLRDAPNLIQTPHVAAASASAIQELKDGVLAQVLQFFAAEDGRR